MKKVVWLGVVLALVILGILVFAVVLDDDDLLFKRSGNPRSLATDPSFIRWDFDGQKWRQMSKPPACPESIAVTVPVDIDKVTGLLYPGQYRGNHFKPHGGFRFDSSRPEDITVRSPVAGHIPIAARYLSSESTDVQYMIDIITPCGLMYRFDHLVNLSPKLKAALAFLPEPKVNNSGGYHLDTPLKIEQAEVLATSVGFSDWQARPNVFVDFGMYDLRQKNSAAKQADWPTDDHGWSELAPYGLCWLELLPPNLGQQLLALPANSNEGRTSAYCGL